MKKIDTTSWRQFCVGELFDIVGGKGITKQEIYEHPGSLPAIQSGEENFGCIGYIDKEYCKEKKYTFSKGECLTVARSGSSGYVGYQASQCVVGDSAKVLEPKFEANTLRLLFVRSALMVLKAKYAYTDKVTNENYAKAIILLPAKNEAPDWQYMEDYMRSIEQRVQCSITAFGDARYGRSNLNTIYWKEYTLDNLFRVVKGKRLTKANMIEGNINYIGATAFNNGVSAKIGNNEYVHPAGTITVCYNGSIGQTFYQEQPFWASDDVNVLYPRFKISKYIAHFICPIIYKLSLNYAYVDKWTAEKMRVAKIKLPATPAGEPDWHYMEMYMRGVEAIVKNKLSLLVPHKPEIALHDAATVNFNNANVTYIDNSKTFNVEK